MELIPKNKPKSWVIYRIAFPVGVFSAFVGIMVPPLFTPSIVLFILLWSVGAISMVINVHGFITGRYQHIESRPWKEQLW